MVHIDEQLMHIEDDLGHIDEQFIMMDQQLAETISDDYNNDMFDQSGASMPLFDQSQSSIINMFKD